MVHATRHPSAHLETVIEFEVAPDEPMGSVAHEPDERALSVRRVVASAGATLAVVLVAVVGTAIATGPAPAAEREAVPACRPVGAPESADGEWLAWCSWPAPTSGLAGVQRMGSP